MQRVKKGDRIGRLMSHRASSRSSWGIRVPLGEPVTVRLDDDPSSRLRLCQATMRPTCEIINPWMNGHCRLSCKFGDGDEVLICSLRKDFREYFMLDLEFQGPCEIVFSVRGVRPIDVCGYFFQEPLFPPAAIFSLIDAVNRVLVGATKEEVPPSGTITCEEIRKNSMWCEGETSQQRSIGGGVPDQLLLTCETQKQAKNDALVCNNQAQMKCDGDDSKNDRNIAIEEGVAESTTLGESGNPVSNDASIEKPYQKDIKPSSSNTIDGGNDQVNALDDAENPGRLVEKSTFAGEEEHPHIFSEERGDQDKCDSVGRKLDFNTLDKQGLKSFEENDIHKALKISEPTCQGNDCVGEGHEVGCPTSEEEISHVCEDHTEIDSPELKQMQGIPGELGEIAHGDNTNMSMVSVGEISQQPAVAPEMESGYQNPEVIVYKDKPMEESHGNDIQDIVNSIVNAIASEYGEKQERSADKSTLVGQVEGAIDPSGEKNSRSRQKKLRKSEKKTSVPAAGVDGDEILGGSESAGQVKSLHPSVDKNETDNVDDESLKEKDLRSGRDDHAGELSDKEKRREDVKSGTADKDVELKEMRTEREDVIRGRADQEAEHKEKETKRKDVISERADQEVELKEMKKKRENVKGERFDHVGKLKKKKKIMRYVIVERADQMVGDETKKNRTLMVSERVDLERELKEKKKKRINKVSGSADHEMEPIKKKRKRMDARSERADQVGEQKQKSAVLVANKNHGENATVASCDLFKSTNHNDAEDNAFYETVQAEDMKRKKKKGRVEEHADTGNEDARPMEKPVLPRSTLSPSDGQESEQIENKKTMIEKVERLGIDTGTPTEKVLESEHGQVKKKKKTKRVRAEGSGIGTSTPNEAHESQNEQKNKKGVTVEDPSKDQGTLIRHAKDSSHRQIVLGLCAQPPIQR